MDWRLPRSSVEEWEWEVKSSQCEDVSIVYVRWWPVGSEEQYGEMQKGREEGWREVFRVHFCGLGVNTGYTPPTPYLLTEKAPKTPGKFS